MARKTATKKSATSKRPPKSQSGGSSSEGPLDIKDEDPAEGVIDKESEEFRLLAQINQRDDVIRVLEQELEASREECDRLRVALSSSIETNFYTKQAFLEVETTSSIRHENGE